MRIYAGDLSLPAFRWLIEHAGWQEPPVAPGVDHQGLDVRQRISKDGIVFSAYPIPRGTVPEVFGRVDLEPLPQWAKSTDISCTISVEELLAQLGLESPEEESFRLLDARLDDVKAYLRSDEFARTRLRREIASVGDNYDATRSVLRQWRKEIGFWRMLRGVAALYVMQRGVLARYRQALRSLGGK